MKNEGPDLTTLIQHMELTPQEFLFEPVKSGKGIIDTKALFMDTLRFIKGDEPSDSENFEFENLKLNNLLLIQLLCRFFSYSWFEGKKEISTDIINLLSPLMEFSKFVKAQDVVNNNDRREEFVRLLLLECSMRPKDETEEQAVERFGSVSTIKRKDTLKGSAAAVKKVKEIRKKMAEKAAREAANVYGRE